MVERRGNLRLAGISEIIREYREYRHITGIAGIREDSINYPEKIYEIKVFLG